MKLSALRRKTVWIGVYPNVASILVIGGGGREHAIVWNLNEEKRHTLWCAPGNAGIAAIAKIPQVDVNDFAALTAFVKTERIELVIVGPEGPLADGMVDALQAEGIRIFGPTQYAAQLESSKIFARDFMAANHIPHPSYAKCISRDEVEHAAGELGLPVVLKADGLAAGKGVIICNDEDELEAGIRTFFDETAFGEAGEVLSVEECLVGTEMSEFDVCDGDNFCILGTAQDYKRALDGDEGPNTGGMGSISPSPLADSDMREEVSATIIQPTLDGMKKAGHPYTGFLYVGLMITEDGPIVIEFNCRMGDPETQVVLPLMNQSLYDVIEAAMEGQVPIAYRVKEASAVSVVLAAEGYPGKYPKGMTIKGLEKLPDDILLFHAGTGKGEEGEIVSLGGRVLNVVAQGGSISAAAKRVYENIETIDFPKSFYRKDIGSQY